MKHNDIKTRENSKHWVKCLRIVTSTTCKQNFSAWRKILHQSAFMTHTLNVTMHLSFSLKCLCAPHLLHISSSHHSSSIHATFISTASVSARGPAPIAFTAGVPFCRNGPSESKSQASINTLFTLSNDLSLLK